MRTGPEGLHPMDSLLAPSSKHETSFCLKVIKMSQSRAKSATLPLKPTDEHNTGSRAGPSTSTGHRLARVPSTPLEPPTVATPPTLPQKTQSIRTRKPRDVRVDRHRGRRSPNGRPTAI